MVKGDWKDCGEIRARRDLNKLMRCDKKWRVY
jgi:hypothetical protein